jgi:hypothetical protein
MRRVGVFATFCVLSSGVGLAGCSASSSNGGLFNSAAQSPQQWTLHLKSEPPGAEAKAPQGQSCRTPCELTLPMADTSVTFMLAGYRPQTIPVTWLPATFHYEMYERTEDADVDYPVDFSPNPVIAQLERGPGGTGASPSGKSRPAKRKVSAARRTQPVTPQ